MDHPTCRPVHESTVASFAIEKTFETLQRQRGVDNPWQTTQNVMEETGNFHILTYESAVEEEKGLA